MTVKFNTETNVDVSPDMKIQGLILTNNTVSVAK